MCALFRWPCSISIYLSASALFRWPCNISIYLFCRSFSVGRRPFRWRCNISIHLSPRSVSCGVRPFPLAMQHFYSFVSQVYHSWCPPFSVGHEAFLFIYFPGLSLVVSALFCWPCSIPVAFLFVCLPALHCWCPPFSVGHVAFLFTCLLGLSLLVSSISVDLTGLSLVVSALFRWPCSISIHLSPRSVTAVCLPFSAGNATFLFISLKGLSMVASALFCWPCSISIRLSPRSVIDHEAFLFVCLPGPSLLVPCSISIHLSFRSVIGGVRPCPLAMKYFYSFVPQVRYCWCPPFSAGNAAFLFICLPGRHYWCPPFSAGDATFLFICFPGLSLVLPPFSAGHVAFLFIRLPFDFFLFVFQAWCLHCCFLPCPLEQVHL